MLTDEQITQRFSKQINKRLRALNIDQRELARRIGINESTLSRYMNGHRDPSYRLIFRMAEALDCEPSYLIDIHDIQN